MYDIFGRCKLDPYTEGAKDFYRGNRYLVKMFPRSGPIDPKILWLYGQGWKDARDSVLTYEMWENSRGEDS